MALEELGLEENKLYKISKKEYLSNHPELGQEKAEIQDKRYDHYEQRRQEAIEEARKIRSEIIQKEEKKGEDSGHKTSKYILSSIFNELPFSTINTSIFFSVTIFLNFW